MDEKRKYPLAEAQQVAIAIKQMLEDYCERIEIAGSIRRRKPMVGDIEILFAPKIWNRQKDMFLEEKFSLADEAIERLEKVGALARRPNKLGRFTYGPLNKLMIHVASGIPVDLFAEPDTGTGWWRSLIIRTGPKELNVRLIENAARHGIKMHAYGIPPFEGTPAVPMNERDVFDICGLPYQEAWERTK